jgi:hypothetical protein
VQVEGEVEGVVGTSFVTPIIESILTYFRCQRDINFMYVLFKKKGGGIILT